MNPARHTSTPRPFPTSRHRVAPNRRLVHAPFAGLAGLPPVAPLASLGRARRSPLAASDPSDLDDRADPGAAWLLGFLGAFVTALIVFGLPRML